jgi:pantothenate kinase type III
MRLSGRLRSTADELGLMFRGLLAGDNVEVTGVAACSTVPAALRSLRTMLARYYGDLPNVVGRKLMAAHATSTQSLWICEVFMLCCEAQRARTNSTV